MEPRLRKALEAMGLWPGANEQAAQEFYARLSLEQKAALGLTLANPVETHTIAPGLEPLQTRNERRDIVTRTVQVRAATINEEERSVEAIVSTETPVEVWDFRRGETVDEVLRADAVALPAQLPLLANHSRWSLDDVLGSIRGLRLDGGNVVGRLHFAADEASQRAWDKVRGGHLTDVSVGYRVLEATEIAPGQTATVMGRQYTAGRRTLRIATKWSPREGSLVPIGADQAAKIREESTPLLQRNLSMNEQLRAYLESIGLRADATEAQAWEFFGNLTGEQRAAADALKSGQRSEPPANPPAPPEPQRSAPPLPTTGAGTDSAEVARQAVAAERERARQIRELAAQDVPEALRQQAIDEGWDLNRANREFLAAVRSQRQPGGQLAGGPSIHSRSHERDVNARSLATALMIQLGQDPTRQRSYDATRQELGPAFTQQDAELGERLRGLSAPDLVRECILADTGRSYRTLDEAFARLREDREMGRSASSGGTLSYVFGTNVYARLIEGWNLVGDSTVGWCDEEDVPNFLAQEEIALDLQGRPEQHAQGKTAPDITVSDKHETYRAYRFARKGSIDELDIINDRLGAVMRIPRLMGQAFRRMRPNLVYSTLLANPTLVADTKAVFHADHGNLGTGALAAAGLAAGLTAISTQRDSQNEVLDIQARFLIVPAALSFTAASLLNSVALAKTHATKTDPDYMPINPVGPSVIKQVIGDNLTLVTDDRIGATGCWNPMTKKMQTGSATNWFLTAGPLNGVRVLWLRGRNRQPAVRSYQLDRGQWGVGWDMNIDIGCTIPDFRGLYKSSGTVA